MCVCVCVCMRAYVCACMCACVCVCVCVRARSRVRMCVSFTRSDSNLLIPYGGGCWTRVSKSEPTSSGRADYGANFRRLGFSTFQRRGFSPVIDDTSYDFSISCREFPPPPQKKQNNNNNNNKQQQQQTTSHLSISTPLPLREGPCSHLYLRTCQNFYAHGPVMMNAQAVSVDGRTWTSSSTGLLVTGFKALCPTVLSTHSQIA